MSSIVLNSNKMFMNLNVTENINVGSNLSVSGNILIKGNLDLSSGLLKLGYNNDATALTGSIRYNPTNKAFEGYSENLWNSLGGESVISGIGIADRDGNTKILTEQNENNNDELLFYTGDKKNSFNTDSFIRMNLSGSNIYSNLNIYNGNPTLQHYLNIQVAQNNHILNYSQLANFKIQQKNADKIVIYDNNDILLNAPRIGINEPSPVVAFQINNTDALKIPKGTTAQRPSANSTAERGYIRYNTQTDQFEGFGAGDAWGSLGGVIDVNQDTYISAETAANINNDELRFYTGTSSTYNNDSPLKMIIDGNINILNNTNINSNLNISANTNIKSNLNIFSNTNIDSNLNISANTNIKSNLNIFANTNINSNLNISANANIKSNLNIFANTNINSNLNIFANTNINSNLNISANTNINSNLNIFSNTNIRSNLNIFSNTNILGDINIKGDVIPQQDSIYDLGSASNRFKDLYISNNSLWIGDVNKISVNSNNELVFNKRKLDNIPKIIREHSTHNGMDNTQMNNLIINYFHNKGLNHIVHISDITTDNWLDYYNYITSQKNRITDVFSEDLEDYESMSTANNWKNNSDNIYYDTGNVGIGSNQPLSKLDVNGHINCTGINEKKNKTIITTSGNPDADFQGVINTEFSFDGIDDYLKIPETIAPQLAGSNFTIEFWAKCNNPNGLNTIYSQGNNSTENMLALSIYQNTILFDIHTYGVKANIPDASILNHFVITFDISENSLLNATKFYINGTLQTTIDHSLGTSNKYTLAEGAVQIGDDITGGYTSSGLAPKFEGELKLLRVWNDARDLTEIAQSISGGNPNLSNYIYSSNLLLYIPMNNNDLYIYNYPIPDISFKTNGNVGIANNNPDYKLDIGGDINFKGKIYKNKSEHAVMPVGCIIMWYGDRNNIPVGWVICDGNNNIPINNISIPDLRNRFIVGAGDSYAEGATGGQDHVTLSLAQMPYHNHGGATHWHELRGNMNNIAESWQDSGYISEMYSGSGRSFMTKLGGYSHKTPDGTDGSGAGGIKIDASHNHGISAQGSNHAHENRPPYYALLYIIFIGY